MPPINPVGVHPSSRLMYGILPTGAHAPIQLDANGLQKIAADVIVGDLINIGLNDAELDGGAGNASAQTLRVVEAANSPLVAAQNMRLNNAQIDSNAGVVSAQTPRFTLATDDINAAAIRVAVQLLDDAVETNRLAANLIVGQAGIAADHGVSDAATPRVAANIINDQNGIAGGSGVDAANVPRVSLATNVALPAGTNAIGKLAANSGVDIGDVGIEPTQAAAAVEGWGDGAAAAKALTASYVEGVGGAVECGGKTLWTADYNLSALGDSPITSFQIQVLGSIDGTNYRVIDDKTVAGGTITLENGLFTRATGGVAATGIFDFETGACTHIKLQAKSTGGDPTNSALYVQIRGSGV